jgi:hypothetical protein
MFADNKPAEGFAYLEQMSRSAAGRGARPICGLAK